MLQIAEILNKQLLENAKILTHSSLCYFFASCVTLVAAMRLDTCISVRALPPDRFTRGDLYVKATQCGLTTPVRNILYQWKQAGLIVKRNAQEYQKAKKRKGA